MNRNLAIVIVLIALFAFISIPFINVTRTSTVKNIDSTRTYEQGLWDGFNGTIKYLDMKGVIKDTIHINVNEISKIDSILHSIRK
jgi:predicted PurR-regulated permease PerM